MTKLDRQILDTAKRIMMEKGILGTDMKDITKEVGCSRSTLYRHFSGKGEILLVLADNALDILRNAQVIPAEYRFTSGLDAFAWQLNSMTDAVINNVEEITFLRDFDCLYSKNYADNHEDDGFVGKVSKSTVKSPLQESYDRGVQDGSIKKVKNPELFILMIFQTLMSTAQRLIPVEKIYIEAYGYGQEILREYVRFVLESIRND